MNNEINIVSPSDQSTVATRTLATDASIQQALTDSNNAQLSWRKTTLKVRAEYCLKAVQWFMDNQVDLALEISQQMGRPIQYAKGEIIGLQERALYMIEVAASALQDIHLDAKPGFTRFIRPTPLGTVLVIAPWNYPYLTAVNAIIPALMAGNCVILKHSAQTLLCAERFAQAFKYAGLPRGVFQYLHLDHEQTAQVVQDPSINFISFTGSVAGGKAIEKSAAGHFKSVALELGGKDAAYVCEDAKLELAVESLVDGAFFNSGQSCCGIERIYVHQNVYEKFVKSFVALTQNAILGDALDSTTTLGPMVNRKAAQHAREQISQALHMGAKVHINEENFPLSQMNSNYLAPQVLTHVNHNMDIMMQESFAPVVGVMKVLSDDDAIKLINDSAYGLTASIWTQDQEAAIEIAERINTGTVFMNRCDYLDPAMPWVGVKDSGRGCSLSHLAYQQLTRPKSFHLKQL